jgi:hypothetical protein
MLDSGFLHQQMRNTLQVSGGINQNGVPVFSEVGQLAGVSATDWSWAPLFADLDNDGLKDLFITNGYLRDFTSMDFLKFTVENARAEARKNGVELNVFQLVSQMASTQTKNYVFKNNGDLTFVNKTTDWGLAIPNLSFGSTYADLDNDGDLELITNNTNQPATIWKNNSESFASNNYLAIELQGSKKNPTGIGAKVWIESEGQLLLAEQYLTRGYQSAVTPVLHFGLGKATQVHVKVVWPDGKISTQANVTSNQKIKISYQNSQVVSVTEGNSTPLFEDITKQSDIDFKHIENKFVDFDREPLLLYQLSRMGPALAHADVNGDSIEDFFVGGAIGQSGSLYLGKGNGQFAMADAQPWQADALQEDISAVFFDVDSDGDADLFVVSGGNEYQTGSHLLDDRLYVNQGKGKFVKVSVGLVADHANGSCVTVADYDRDGDLDLFVGGASQPGNFPFVSPGAILKNETDRKTGKISFVVTTPEVNPDLRLTGIVTDAVWTDINNDQWPDLMVVGEWMPIRLFENRNGKLIEVKNATLEQTHGLWSRVVATDLDQDGDIDFVIGNAGLNLPWKVSDAAPLHLYYEDFDGDGKTDPLLFYTQQDKLYPVASRDEMLRQLPALKKKFTSYAAYGNATLTEILTSQQIAQAKQLKITALASGVLKNLGNSKFEFRLLPTAAQLSAVRAIEVADFTNDGQLDILLAGNFYPFNTQYGPADAGKGLLLAGNDGSFQPVHAKHGFYAAGDVRNMKMLAGRNSKFIVVGRNDDSISIF